MKHLVFMAVAMPPPVHGQSQVNKFIYNGLSDCQDADVVVCDIGPGLRRRGVFYHMTRVIKVLLACARLVLYRIMQRRISFYGVYESGFGFFYNLVLYSLARTLSVSSIFVHHHTSQHCLKKSWKFRFLLNIVGQQVTHISISDGMKRDIIKKYGACSVVSVNNAFFADLREGINYFSHSEKEMFTIGYISNITEEKGVYKVFEVFCILAQEDERYRLHIAGPIKDHEITLRLHDLCAKFPGRVKYFGSVYGVEKVDFYNSCDVTLFPSSYKFEALPLVVLESMSLSVPCIATTQGYTSDAYGVGLEGLLIDIDSYVADACGVISKMLCDEFYLSEISKASDANFRVRSDLSKSQFNDLIFLISRGD